MQTLKLNRGLALVEVVLGTAIILVLLLAIFGVNNVYFKTALSNTDAVKATLLAEEGIEAMRFLRDVSWNNNIAPLSAGTDYYLVFASNTWQATTTLSFIDGTFERTATVADVYRDVLDDITTSGGTLDPGIKLLTVTVAWSGGASTSTKSISTYIADLVAE